MSRHQTRRTASTAAEARPEGAAAAFDGLDPDYFEINYVTVTEPFESLGVQLYDPLDYE